MTSTAPSIAPCSAANTALPPLLVFADDWGRHPSSCQHLARHWLEQHQVIWVNTIGTRPPRLDRVTFQRGLGKLKQWFRPTNGIAEQHEHPNLTIRNPKMWPWFRSNFDRGLNRCLLRRQLDTVLDGLPQPPIAITTLPLVADLMDEFPVQQWVYYCVDDLSQWPGLDGAALLRMERKLVQQADHLLAASRHLQERLAGLGRESYLLTHGVDLPVWQNPIPHTQPVEWLELPRPWIVFWGLIDQRLDVGFIRDLVRHLTTGTLLLVGPEENPDPELRRLPHVAHLGRQPLHTLPSLAQHAAVLVMPYADLPVTRAMQPLKLLEYLATGKPVVVRDLPANRAWADCLDLAATGEEFTGLVQQRLTSGLPIRQAQARQRLQTESWKVKARQFRDWLAPLCTLS